MSETKKPEEWRVIAETVPGASHLRAGVPNQDSVLFVRESSRGLPIVLSVSDGHGSAKCFRSDRGSQFAVREAVHLLSSVLHEGLDATDIDGEKVRLAAEFVGRWRGAVEADLGFEPIAEDELRGLEEKSDAKARELVTDNPLLAYGATSLTVAILGEFIVYMQLGDGEFLSISAAGEVVKPIAEDARLMANETTSLCLPKAEQDVRFHVQEISPAEPAMIMVSTDGYLNSFSSEAGFFQAGTDILNMLKEEAGFDAVNENLKSWLEEATAVGSGDDCTVAILYRPALLAEQAGPNTRETTVVETPSSAETSKAIAAFTDSEELSPEQMEDVTVTITIKKDKNKKPGSKSASAATDASSNTSEGEKSDKVDAAAAEDGRAD